MKLKGTSNFDQFPVKFADLNNNAIFIRQSRKGAIKLNPSQLKTNLSLFILLL